MIYEEKNELMKIQAPKITVVVPVFNPGQYLRPCLDTIIGQTIRDIEIICIDDCSEDDSLKLLYEYAEKDNRIIVLHNPYNIGAARTRNIGIQLARGEYIVFLDADDYFELDYFEQMYIKCRKYDADVGICNILFRDERTGLERQNVYKPALLLEKTRTVWNVETVPLQIFTLFDVVPYNKLIKREFIINNHLSFQDISNSNDVYFGVVTLMLAERIVSDEKAYIHYRMNIGSQISAKRGNNPECCFEALAWIYKALVLNGKWELLQKSYFEFCVGSILYSFSYSRGETRRAFLKRLQERELAKLGLENCEAEHFFKDSTFSRFVQLKTKQDDGDIAPESDYSKGRNCREFLRMLASRKMNWAMWGFGRIGERFLQACEENQILPVEIYDKDIKKHGRLAGGIKITDWQHSAENIDAVVITVSGVVAEIEAVVRASNKELKLIHFFDYYNWGIEFDDCITEITKMSVKEGE